MPGYISEYDHYGNSPEFIELAIPVGTDVSAYQIVIYGSDGYVDHTINLSDLTVQGTMGGHDVYVIESGTPGFSGIDSGDSTALIDDSGTVLQFVTHTSAVTAQDGPAAGETSTYIGNAAGVGNSLQSDNGGASYYVQTSTNPGTIPCYAPGTLIDTPAGPRAVEALRPGDLALTLDHGPQEILWARAGDQALEDVDDDARPVLIKAGALGQGLPAHDLIISPQHRILVGGQGQVEDIFERENLAAAKSLTGLPGIRAMRGKQNITWIHFACARHQVVFANGCMAESLLLGPMVLQGLHRGERKAVSLIFAHSKIEDDTLNGPPVRNCLPVQAVEKAIMHHKRSRETADSYRQLDRDAATAWYVVDRLSTHTRLEKARVV